MEPVVAPAWDDDDPVLLLRSAGAELPRGLRERVLALGTAGVPALIALLEDEDAHLENSAGSSWAPIHAVDLLADLKAIEAVAPMLRVLETTTWDTVIHDRAVMRLPELGLAVFEPGMAQLSHTRDPEVRSSICGVLSQLGVQDERLFSELCRLFKDDPTLGALCLGDYGDRRALALLEHAIVNFEPDREGRLGLIGLNDLLEAHEQLGGALSEALRAHVDRLRRGWQARTAIAPTRDNATATRAVGRNDPCPCGSGRKYKKCCLAGNPA